MFRNILIPLDGSSLAECVLPHAIALARAFEARCVLLRVLMADAELETVPFADPLKWRLDKAEVEAYFDKVSEFLEAAGVSSESVILEGQPAQRILEYAYEHRIDLLLLSSHGRTGLNRWNISSVVQKTVQNANISTMIVRAYQLLPTDTVDLSYEHLLVPLDGSTRAEIALAPARILSEHFDSKMSVIQMVARPEMPRQAPPSREEAELSSKLLNKNYHAALRYMERLEPQLPANAETRVIQAQDVPTTLQKEVETRDIDLVLMSAHGYSGSGTRPFGGVTTNIILYGSKPLLIVQDLPPDMIQSSRATRPGTEKKGH